MGLWAVAGSHCMSYKTDGFVPDWFVLSWPQGKKLAAQLVKYNLWEPATRDDETGYQFHDWSHFQPHSDEIEADRAYARERQRRRRAKLRESRQKGDESP